LVANVQVLPPSELYGTVTDVLVVESRHLNLSICVVGIA